MRSSFRRGRLLLAGAVASVSVAGFAGPATAILNGRPAAAGAYPWMVALVATSQGGQAADGQFCGGVLIAPDRVLTAAHCVEDISNPHQIEVVVGGNRLSATADGDRVKVRAYGVEPRSKVGQNASTIPFDLAVLVLGRNVANAHPIEVLHPDEGDLIAPGAAIRALGWGAVRQVQKTAFIDPFEIPADVLREADLQVVSGSDCERVNGRLYRDDSMRCVIDTATNTSPICHGDSGGPAVVQVPDGSWRLVGVASFNGGDCGAVGVPTVYAFAPAAADLLPPASPKLAPVPPGRPKVAGLARVGTRLSCERGRWVGGRGKFDYRWAWVKPESGTAARTTAADRADLSRIAGWSAALIPGAKAATYRLGIDDEGVRVACVVRGRNASGRGVSVSLPTKLVH